MHVFEFCTNLDAILTAGISCEIPIDEMATNIRCGSPWLAHPATPDAGAAEYTIVLVVRLMTLTTGGATVSNSGLIDELVAERERHTVLPVSDRQRSMPTQRAEFAGAGTFHHRDYERDAVRIKRSVVAQAE
ncbi:MAG: hypothetical protein WBA63_04225 [Thermomicrobiales bacterium]